MTRSDVARGSRATACLVSLAGRHPRASTLRSLLRVALPSNPPRPRRQEPPRTGDVLRLLTVTLFVLATTTLSANAIPGRSLQQQARYVAAHGGIRSHRYGDASPEMKQLVRALIRETFKPAGWAAVQHALCYSRRESGWNPAADSPSDDHGAFQVHRASYHPFDWARVASDPAYSVWVGWVVSSHGTDWSPWNGGTRPC